MKLSRRIMVMAICLTILTGVGIAQDEPGCKDHPLLTRMPNFIIQGCETKDFDSHEFFTGEESQVTVEGAKYYLSYAIKEGSQPPSVLQILRNYSNAIQRIGGSVLYTDGSNAYLKVTREGKEAWVHIYIWNGVEGYDLTIIEKKAMRQDITANDMLDALNGQGFIALYILFDTNLAVIKPESWPIVEQIAKMLADHPELRVSIEGHTDNTGTPQGNKTLSLKRADAVVASLVKLSIDPKRLSAVGWGQEKPVADNRSEESKAKNRRVEIVKK